VTATTETDRSPSKIIVVDTNVLLADPNSLLSFPHAEIVVPETVLGELDKLKTARVDPDLRFRGREVSRLLFEFSEDASLVEGVDLPDGGRLRVAPFDSDAPMPEGLSSRNSDDKILATALSVCKASDAGCEVTLLTNDLNMLLKAQTMGVPVERYGNGTEGGFARRFIIRPFQRYKIQIGILSVALAVFAGIIAIALFVRPSGTGVIPSDLRQILSPQQQQAMDALVTLESDPRDEQALKTMGDFYYDQVTNAQSLGQRSSVIQLSKRGIGYYEQYLKLKPDDHDVRSDMASLLFYSGQTDAAIREVGLVLEKDPKHVSANFNLGIFYLQGRRDLQAAKDQMETVVALTKDSTNVEMHAAYQQAQKILDQIRAEESSSTAPSSGSIQ
jgi:rRNA-processing protein FCF1